MNMYASRRTDGRSRASPLTLHPMTSLVNVESLGSFDEDCIYLPGNPRELLALLRRMGASVSEFNAPKLRAERAATYLQEVTTT